MIDKLPDGQRACILLFYYAQNTIAQIADMLETNENTVKTRLALARQKIRAALEDKAKNEGIKLWGIPLGLTQILRQEHDNFVMPQGAEARILDFISRSTLENMGANASSGTEQPVSLGKASVQPTMSSISGTATKTAGKAVANTLLKKAIIALLSVAGAVAVITAGIIVTPMLIGSPDTPKPPGAIDMTSPEETSEELQNGGVTPTETPASEITPPDNGGIPTFVPSESIPVLDTLSVADVVGRQRNEAVTVLENQGFNVTIEEEYNDTVQVESVIYQTPQAGSELVEFSDVVIVISKGVAAVGNTGGNINNDGGAAIQGEWIYYSVITGRDFTTSDNRLCRVRTDGSGFEIISNELVEYINVIGDTIYYRNGNDGHTIYAMKTDGSEKRRLCDDVVFFITVVGDRIYYSNYSDEYRLYAINTDGSNRQKLCDDSIMFMAVSGNYVYYSALNDGKKTYSIRIDGTDRQKLNDDESWFINVVGGRIYYCNHSDGQNIYSMNTDGSDRRRITDDKAGAMCVSGDRIYYENYSDPPGKMYTINLDGSGRRKLNDLRSYMINVVGDQIYYYGFEAGLFVMNTDGSNNRHID